MGVVGAMADTDSDTTAAENGGENSADTTVSTEAAVSDAQETLGDAGKRALDAERELKRAAERAQKNTKKELDAALAKLKEIEDREKSELQLAQEAADVYARQAAEATSKLLRHEVAAEKGLTGDALALLTGSTREELEAKADSILAIIENSKPKGGPHVPEEGKTPDASDADLIAQRILLGNIV